MTQGSWTAIIVALGLNESLWLKCSNGEDEEDKKEDEEEDGEHDMDVKFGGARLNLTLGNFHRKWRL